MRSHPFIVSLVLGLTGAACSGGSSSTSAALVPTPPSGFLLQYAGEYDAAGDGSLAQLVLHVDGTLDATLDGQTTRGAYSGADGAGEEARATLTLGDGSTLVASFRVEGTASSPPQARLYVGVDGGRSETLVAPWIAGNEGMCGASHGAWHDEATGASAGVRCDCSAGDVYLPSRGGCVAPRGEEDPPRLPPSNAALRRAGIFDGTRRVSTITLATDGRYMATLDGRVEEGTWWDATYSPSYDEDSGIGIGCTSAWHAFGATLDDAGTLTVRLGSGESETLQRRRD